MFFISKKKFEEEVMRRLYHERDEEARNAQIANMDCRIDRLYADVMELIAWKNEIMHNSEVR